MTTKFLSQINQLLRLILKPLRRQSGAESFKLYAAGAYTGLELDSIINGATAATVSVYEENDVDKLSDRGLGATTVPPGAYLPAPEGKKITKITSDQDFIGYLTTE